MCALEDGDTKVQERLGHFERAIQSIRYAAGERLSIFQLGFNPGLVRYLTDDLRWCQT